MTIKGRTLDDWAEWLDAQLSGRGETNLKPDEIYVLEGFQEAVMMLRALGCALHLPQERCNA